MSELILSISDSESLIKATKEDPDGSVSVKYITHGSLVSSLTNGLVMQTNMLVRGTRFYFGDASKYIVGIETVPKVRQVLYGYEKPYKKLYVPFPPCLFFFKVVNGVMTNSYAFGLRNSIMTYDDTLYRFPFGNVYDSGIICWGYVDIQDALKSPMQLGSYLAAFFDSPYNGDLHDGCYKRITPKDYNKINNIADVFYYLNGKDKFDYDLLNPTRLVVRDVIKTLGGVI